MYYINDLIQRLQSLNKGCFIGGMFVGVLVYADDIVLLTPTPNAMRELLTICDDFSSEFDVTFNSMKSKCLYFHAKTAKKTDATLPDFFIGGNHIEFVESWNLGII